MNEFLVDFLPTDLRQSGMMLSSRRRSMLLIGLLCAMVIGAAAHSWNRYRQAEAERIVSLQVTTNSSKVDEVVNKFAAEQQSLTRFLLAYEQIGLPLEQSDLIATITNVLPERVSLSKLRMDVEQEKSEKKDEKAKPAGKSGRAGKGAAAAAAAEAAKPKTPLARWITLQLKGFAATTDDLYYFQRMLAATAPFEGVTVNESKSIDVPGARIQEWVMSCRVPIRPMVVTASDPDHPRDPLPGAPTDPGSQMTIAPAKPPVPPEAVAAASASSASSKSAAKSGAAGAKSGAHPASKSPASKTAASKSSSGKAAASPATKPSGAAGSGGSQ